jgi:hypothetical protein
MLDSADVGTDAQCAAPAESKLSEQLWGFRWSDHLPKTLTKDGLYVDYIDYEDAIPFVRENYSTIFQESDENPFSGGKISAARSRYYRHAADCFAFKKGNEFGGLFLCTPVDWSTYYIRSTAFVSHFEGRNLIPLFFPHFFKVLKDAGVERVEAETSPSNMRVVYMLTRQRFNVSGSVLSERWGALTKFTKFLDEESEEVFLQQFCSGRKPQRNKRGRQAA